MVPVWSAFPDDVYVVSTPYNGTSGYWMSNYNLKEINDWGKANEAYHDMLKSCPAVVETPVQEVPPTK